MYSQSPLTAHTGAAAAPRQTASRTVPHPLTNESVRGIFEALSPSPSDSILCVCGSGDIPFALASSGARITACDLSAAQIEFARARKELIKRKDFPAFLNTETLILDDMEKIAKPERDQFFLEGDRLEKIHALHENIQFLLGDVFSLAGLTFTKVYLSNTLCDADFTQISTRVKKLAQMLQPPALIYDACAGEGVPLALQDARDFGGAFGDPNSWPQNVVEEKERSRIAQSFEKGRWRPGVFRVI